MMHLAPFGVLVVVSVIGTIGNILIIGAVCIYKRLRVRSHVFIVNLAIADLLVTSYIMPVGLATSQFKHNPFGEMMCDLNAFLIMTSCGVSTQTLMAIALERYFHICRTNLYKTIFTPKLLAFYVVFIWLYTALWTSQGYTPWTQYKYSDSMYICIFDGAQSISYNVCLALVGMIIPIIVVTVSYILIFRTVRGGRKALEAHRKRLDSYQSNSSNGNNNNGNSSPNLFNSNLEREHRKNRREHQFVMTLLAIVIMFVICWTPATFVLTFTGIWTAMPDILWPCAMWLAFCNSSMNSIVYGVMNKHFRTGYLELLEYMLCCRRCRCDKSAMYASDASLNSQSRLAAAYSSRSTSPTNHSNFRFPTNELKGYGTRNVTPSYQEIPGGHPNGVVGGDILRHRVASTSNKPEELHSNENNFKSTEDVWHYPQPDAEYIYGAFSSGNSSIITIESTISEDSDIDEIYNRRSRQYLGSSPQNDSLNYHPYHGSKGDRSRSFSGSDVSPDYDHIYDVIGNVHRGRIKSPVKTTNIVGLRSGDISPIYEVPLPEGEGEIILPTQVKRTPVFRRTKEPTTHKSKPRGDVKPSSEKETRL